MSMQLGAPVEGYRKSDTPATIATRFAELVAEANGTKWKPRSPRTPKFVNHCGVAQAVGEADSLPCNSTALVFPVKNGRVWIDTACWPEIRAAVESHSGGLIIDHDGAPVAALPSQEFATKDSELLACDVECRLAGIEGFYLELEITGLDEVIGGDGLLKLTR
jgi:hypothetical protein